MELAAVQSTPVVDDMRPSACAICSSPTWNRDVWGNRPGFCSDEHLLLGRMACDDVDGLPPLAAFVETDARCTRCGVLFVVRALRVLPTAEQPWRCPGCSAERPTFGEMPAQCRHPPATPGERLLEAARLYCAGGSTLERAAATIGVSRGTLRKWSRRFAESGLVTLPTTTATKTCIYCHNGFTVTVVNDRSTTGWYGYKRGPFCSRDHAQRFHAECSTVHVYHLVCRRCGRPFTTRAVGFDPPRGFCSTQCKNHAREVGAGMAERVATVCVVCGTRFDATQRPGDAPLRHCSQSCYDAAGEPPMPGRQRIVATGCERCGGSFVYRHGMDSFRRYCATSCQRRAASERAWAKRRRRLAPCVVCGSDTRRGQSGVPAQTCSTECEAARVARSLVRACSRCQQPFTAPRAGSSRHVCDQCHSGVARIAAAALADTGMAQLNAGHDGFLRHASETLVEATMHFGMASRYVHREESGDGAARALRVAVRCVRQSVEGLRSLLPLDPFTPSPPPRTTGVALMVALEGRARAAVDALEGCRSALRRGQIEQARAQASTALASLRQLDSDIIVAERGLPSAALGTVAPQAWSAPQPRA